VTLQNLQRIGEIKDHAPTAAEVQRLLAAIDRNDAWVVLDALRRQRNANDYTGAPMTPDIVVECLTQAKTLRKLLRAQLANKHPELMKPA
jgi:hypothetical protein